MLGTLGVEMVVEMALRLVFEADCFVRTISPLHGYSDDDKIRIIGE